MKTITATKFKEQCLALLESVDRDGLIITKRGKPVAKLVPAVEKSFDLIGSLKNELKVNGPILSTGVKWNAES